jgi:ElaB/YqjD/DUF883 family membrane-anchored ribosome-binding protein
VLYDQTHSYLEANLDDSVQIAGGLTPKTTKSGEAVASQVSASGDTEPRYTYLSSGGAEPQYTRLGSGSSESQYMLLSSGGLPDLPAMPTLPNPTQYFNDAIGTVQEQVKAYQKAVEAEIASYQKMVEDQINSAKNMTQQQIDAYREQAMSVLSQYKNQVLGVLAGFSDEIRKYSKQIEDALNEYINVGMLSDGLMEFEAENLSFGMLDALESAGVDTTIRFGYDMRNKRCYYAVGVTSAAKESGGNNGGGTENKDDGVVDIGVAKIKNFAGLFFHNMDTPTDIKNPKAFSDEMRTPDGLKKYIQAIPVYRGDGTTDGMGIICDFIIGDAAMLKDVYLYIASGPIISASGELHVKTNMKDFKLVCAASICYSHPERYLSISTTVKDIPVLLFNVSGSIGFEVGTRPAVFGVYIGYPETLKLGKILGVAEIGAGFCFRIADGPDYVAIKVEAGLDVNIDIYIVYARGYLKFGADGMYKFISDAPDEFMINLWIKGGLSGGIRVLGKKWNIIELYADAIGTLEGELGSKVKLRASAKIKVGYHLDVLLTTFSGSVSYKFSHSFSL